MSIDSLKNTVNNLSKGEWKVYKFKARVKDDDGYEADINFMNGKIYATYCWSGDSEFCATSIDFYERMVSKTYKSIGEIVFEL